MSDSVRPHRWQPTRLPRQPGLPHPAQTPGSRPAWAPRPPHRPRFLAQPGLPRPPQPGLGLSVGAGGSSCGRVHRLCLQDVGDQYPVALELMVCVCPRVYVCVCTCGECMQWAGPECRASSGSWASGQRGGASGGGDRFSCPRRCSFCSIAGTRVHSPDRERSWVGSRSLGCRALWGLWCLGVCGQEGGAWGWGPHTPGP